MHERPGDVDATVLTALLKIEGSGTRTRRAAADPHQLRRPRAERWAPGDGVTRRAQPPGGAVQPAGVQSGEVPAQLPRNRVRPLRPAEHLRQPRRLPQVLPPALTPRGGAPLPVRQAHLP